MPVARSDVVDDGVAPDMRHRIFSCNALAAHADDDGEFSFVVNRSGHRGHFNGGVRANHGLGDLGKDDRVSGNLSAGFGAAVKPTAGKLLGVRKVVFANAENIPPGFWQRRNDAHITHGNRSQQRRQWLAACLHLDDGQGAQAALRWRHVERLDLLEIFRNQANARLAIVLKGDDFHRVGVSCLFNRIRDCDDARLFGGC